MNDVGIVLIGRNEGQRLVRALDAAAREGARVVYVDSGSTDGSLAAAQQRGAHVVELDTSIPFTAARARNAGLEALRLLEPSARYVQFIDGDCVLEPGWVGVAKAALDGEERLAVVFGRRREERVEASVYHRLIDLEWDRPAGLAEWCGGDAMMRLEALREVGGYDPTVAAGEEPELCMRLRAVGWWVRCVDHPMTRHDAAIHRLGAFLRRDIRTGRGALDLVLKQPQRDNPFIPIVKQTMLWGWGWAGWMVAMAIFVVVLTPVWVGLAGLLLGGLGQAMRMARQVRYGLSRKLSARDAGVLGLLVVPGTLAQMWGQVRYLIDRATGQRTRLVEYKHTPPAPDTSPDTASG